MSNKQRDIELLKFMHENAEMGKNTLAQINDIVTESAFREVLQKQLLEYKNVYDHTERKLNALGEDARDINGMLKTSAYLMINMKTMMDKTPSHVSEMIIQGGTMGIIQITKKLKEYIDCCDDVKNIAYKLMWIEEKNIQEMKHFL